jgi:hypothetical protein
MIIDVFLGTAVLLDAWLLSSLTVPLFPLNRLKARSSTPESNVAEKIVP